MELQLFSTQDGRSLQWQYFLQHSLGQLYQTIPFEDISKLFPTKQTKSGRKPWFEICGGIGLQVLKHYYGCSDKKLIDLLNENKMMQFFCGINLKVGQRIKDDDVVSRWRLFLGQHLPLNEFQKLLAREWKGDMKQTQSNLSDATCYESYVRYPTDEKLLWECIDYLWHSMKKICRLIRYPMPRSKFKEQQKKFLSFQKQRRKTHKQRRRVRKRLLYLLTKLMNALPIIIGAWRSYELKQLNSTTVVKSSFLKKFFTKLKTIKKILKQQQLHFDQPQISIPQRIVSLAKPYLRPIIRGKENVGGKRVEFGMKVHKMQIDGINFIEHWDFEAFHEGIRMKQTIWKHRTYFGKCAHFGGDQIYANNANRKFCTSQNISTCFRPKGRTIKNKTTHKQAQQLRQLIGKERATRLEGSFGNDKNHYLLRRVKARNLFTEKCWIFFGIFTANVVAIAKKRTTSPP